MRAERLDRAGERGHGAAEALRTDAGGVYLVEDALLHVGGKTPARELAPLAEQAGVHLTRLSDYAVMQNDESRVVLLGFSGMDEDQIRQGLSALKKAWG